MIQIFDPKNLMLMGLVAYGINYGDKNQLFSTYFDKSGNFPSIGPNFS